MGNSLTISSFIIRFVSTGPSTDPPTDDAVYHGIIRHIQSDQEMAFTQWNDAVTFIQGFVPLIGRDDSRIIEEESDTG